MILQETGTKPVWNRYNNIDSTSFDKLTVANGYTNSFVMTTKQLRELALKSSFNSDLQLKIFGNPSSVIQSIFIFPFNIDVTTSEQGIMYLGGYKTEINCYAYYAQRYIRLNMGDIRINGEDFSDYTGYCSAQIFFPYLGFIDYNINDIIDRDIQFWLYIDIKTGNGIYTVETYDTYDDGSKYRRVISTHITKIAVEIPAGNSGAGERALDMAIRTIQTGVNMATSYLAPTPITTTTSKELTTYTKRNRDTGRQIKTATRSKDRVTTSQSTNDKSEIFVDAFNSSISSIANSHIYTQSDRVNGIADLNFLTNTIQVVIRKPKMVRTDSEYNHLFGRPLGEIRKLGDMKGFTIISNVHLDGFNSGITSTELDILDSVLKDGIII